MEELITKEEQLLLDNKVNKCIEKQELTSFEVENREIAKKYHNYLKKYDNMKNFSYDINGKLIFVIKPFIKIEESADDIIKRVQLYNKRKDYKNAIKEQQKLINFYPNPMTYIYIGLNYLNLYEIDKAIEYMEIGIAFNNISSKKNKKVDKYISVYKELVENKKLDNEMLENKNTYKSFEIDNIDKIIEEIVTTRKSIRLVCEENNLSYEDTLHVYLYIAKKYYEQREIKEGDRFLLILEKSKKPKYIAKEVDELRKNRLFYQNQEEKEDSKKLSLYLKK